MKRRHFITGLGSAAVWPLAARAQQRTLPVIGYLNAGPENVDYGRAAFLRGLGERGFVEGRNVGFLYHHADGQNDRLPALAEDFVRRQVSVMFAAGGALRSVRAALSLTKTIPIVFAAGNDPVQFGLVASLNRPGGNATGTFFLTGALVAKRIELLHEVVPAATSIGFLVPPTGPASAAQTRDAETAAGILRVRLVILNAITPDEIETTFASLARQGIGALSTAANAFYFDQRNQFAALAARHKVPAIYAQREFVEAGGLMSYGPSISDAYRVAGTSAAFSKAKSPPTCPCSSPHASRPSSTSRPPKRSALRYRPRPCSAPKMLSNRPRLLQRAISDTGRVARTEKVGLRGRRRTC